MDLATAADRINEYEDLSARICGAVIEVSVYGRPAGTVSQDDLDQLGHTATGWGKSLRKGALQVYRALTED
jgi:hypothetical protein